MHMDIQTVACLSAERRLYDEVDRANERRPKITTSDYVFCNFSKQHLYFPFPFSQHRSLARDNRQSAAPHSVDLRLR